MKKGQFRKGFDPRRHVFTQDECIAGFWKMIDSIVERYPHMKDKSGNHLVKYALKFLTRRAVGGGR